MAEGSVPSTRLSATALLEGCWKVTLAWLPMLKLFQFRMARALSCWTTMALPDWLIAAWPETT